MMTTPSSRLRRAIHLRSVSLVDRILTSNPSSPNLIRNHDPNDKNNTSLHLAALLGLPEIARYLLDNGHEDPGISRNLDLCTPLMLTALTGSDASNAVTRGRVEVARLLIERCPDSIYAKDRSGMDAFLLAAKHGTLPLIEIILDLPPPSESRYTAFDAASSWLCCVDHDFNTPLHYASAFGELKTVRLLIVAGADDKATNAAGWTAQAYSASVAAEVYLRRLIQEREAGKVIDAIERSATVIERDIQKRKARGMVRVVTSDGDQGTGDILPGRFERTRARTAT